MDLRQPDNMRQFGMHPLCITEQWEAYLNPIFDAT